MFCSVCKSSGKPESVFTSHFVKDKPGPDGVVVCPTLLSQKCGYCHEKGHTPKFCPKLKAKDGLTDGSCGGKKPFCSVCHSAGLSVEIYTSHFVKDKPGPDGVVVCPTLLSQKCRYCHANGHTPKFCPVLAEKNRREKMHRDTKSYRSCQQHQLVSANQALQTQKAPKPLYPQFFPTLKESEAKHNGFTCDGACHPDAMSPPPWVHKGSRDYRKYGGRRHAHTPMYPEYKRSEVFPHLSVKVVEHAVHKKLQKQQENEEFVSSWAGMSTAYTSDEESKSALEMDLEAEYLADIDMMPDETALSDAMDDSIPKLEVYPYPALVRQVATTISVI